MGNIFFVLIIQPITNALVAIYQLLVSMGIPYALGFAIILLTVLIRFLLYPLISSQMKASKKMQELQPHLSRVKEQHKNDAARLQQETMALYKAHGVNPVAGCLPLLIQMPIIWGLYTVLNDTVRQTSYQAINKVLYTDSLHLSKLWDPYFFGVALAQTPAELWKTAGPIVILVPLVTGALQFVQSKMMVPAKPAEVKKEPAKEPDFATAFQTQSLYVIPIMVAVFSWSLPFGLSLYWNTFTIFGIIQQYLSQRGQPAPQIALAQPAKPALKKKRK